MSVLVTIKTIFSEIKPLKAISSVRITTKDEYTVVSSNSPTANLYNFHSADTTLFKIDIILADRCPDLQVYIVGWRVFIGKWLRWGITNKGNE